MPLSPGRREFLAGAVASTLVAASASGTPEPPPATNPTDPALPPVTLGIMGLQRGLALANQFRQLPHVQIKYLCDPDERRVAAAQLKLQSDTQPPPQGVHDFRRILDDPQVDALVCAAPNHWHAPATILACQAGKHVYVEKPCCHSPWEGEQMVAAARKHGRVVQMGSQRRSSPPIQLAMQHLHQGIIGRVYHARATYFANRESIGKGQSVPVPSELDYDLWQGPAPRRPYLDNVVHYNWHWRWHWGNGELGNNGVHTIDLCRWGLQVEYPQRVSSSGGRYCYQDDQETPDTQTVCYEFDGARSITWQGMSCNAHGTGSVTFYGERGALDLRLDGTFTAYDDKQQEIARSDDKNQGDMDHLVNFLQAVRNNSSQTLNAEIQVGYQSTLLCLLGNIAHRTGRVLQIDSTNGTIVGDPPAAQWWKRDYAPGWEPNV